MKNRERDVVRGFEVLGDPVAINWLIQKAEEPVLSRLSGGSITMITGIDLAKQDIEKVDEPEGVGDDGINDNPEDCNVALDEDKDLPWPDSALLSAWWQSSAKLPASICFLNGREKNRPERHYVLVDGMQIQRNAAAVSLAFLNPESTYLDTRLPTSRQKLCRVKMKHLNNSGMLDGYTIGMKPCSRGCMVVVFNGSFCISNAREQKPTLLDEQLPIVKGMEWWT